MKNEQKSDCKNYGNPTFLDSPDFLEFQDSKSTKSKQRNFAFYEEDEIMRPSEEFRPTYEIVKSFPSRKIRLGDSAVGNMDS